MAVIERLWDDPEFEAEHRRRALAEAGRWDRARLAEEYEGFLLSMTPQTAAAEWPWLLTVPRPRWAQGLIPSCQDVPRTAGLVGDG